MEVWTIQLFLNMKNHDSTWKSGTNNETVTKLIEFVHGEYTTEIIKDILGVFKEESTLEPREGFMIEALMIA